MKTALAAVRLVNRDVSYNVQQMKRYMQMAKEHSAQLICSGESYLQGSDCLSWDFPERFAQGQDWFFRPVYVEWSEQQWLASEKQAYANQAKACCKTTLYVNSICGNDTHGGAALFENGAVRQKRRWGPIIC